MMIMVSIMRLHGYEVSELDGFPRIWTEDKAEVWSAKLEASRLPNIEGGKALVRLDCSSLMPEESQGKRTLRAENKDSFRIMQSKRYRWKALAGNNRDLV